MACFARPDTPNTPFVADCFAPGESVTLRPRLDWSIETEASQKGLRVPPGMDQQALQALSSAELNVLLQQNADAKAVVLHKLSRMIESWTLRYEPTAEQRERGEPGDVAPLTPEMIAALPVSYANAIAAEIERRGGALSDADVRGPEGDPTTARSNSQSEESSSTGLALLSGEKSTKRGS